MRSQGSLGGGPRYIECTHPKVGKLLLKVICGTIGKAVKVHGGQRGGNIIALVALSEKEEGRVRMLALFM